MRGETADLTISPIHHATIGTVDPDMVEMIQNVNSQKVIFKCYDDFLVFCFSLVALEVSYYLDFIC